MSSAFLGVFLFCCFRSIPPKAVVWGPLPELSLSHKDKCPIMESAWGGTLAGREETATTQGGDGESSQPPWWEPLSPAQRPQGLMDLLGTVQKGPGGSHLISTSLTCWGHRRGWCPKPPPSLLQ